MSMQPWNVLVAKKVEWHLPNGDEEWLAFRHVNTRVTDVSDDGCARGFTLWSTDLDGDPAFMSFDWVELRPGVPILTDPNMVLTNLCIVNNDGQQESKLREVAHVNVMVYKTQWQEAARQAVSEYEGQPKGREANVGCRRNQRALTVDRAEGGLSTVNRLDRSDTSDANAAVW